MTTHDPDMRN